MQRFALAEIAAGCLIGKLPSGLAVTIAVRDMSGAAIAITSAVCTEQGTTGLYRWALSNITVPPVAFAEYTYVMTSANNDTYEDACIISGYPDVIDGKIGTPIALDGGLATLSGNMTKLADDNNGADYDAATDSLHEVSIKVGVAAASAVAVDGRLPSDPADESDVEAAITASQGVITTAISTSESNIRGADGDDLKDISDQIDGVAIDAAASAASSAAAAASAAAVDGRLPLDPADESNVLGAIAGVSGQINAVPGDVWDEPVAPHNIADTFGQRTEDAYQWDFGEWQIVGDQIIYRDKAGVEIGRCDLFDQAGNPTMVNIFRRVPI